MESPVRSHSNRPRDHLPPDVGLVECLSVREREVMQLVVEGQTSVQIAAHLCLSPKTVETYRSRLMIKLDIPNLAGLVKFAIRNELTTLD